jgi:hypothetical protein
MHYDYKNQNHASGTFLDTKSERKKTPIPICTAHVCNSPNWAHGTFKERLSSENRHKYHHEKLDISSLAFILQMQPKQHKKAQSS